MKKNDGILLGQPDELMEMLFFNTYQGTVNIKALTHHLFYILDGSLTLLYQAKKYVLSTDDIFFIPLEEVIILSSNQCHALTLAIPPSRFSDSSPHIYCNSALFPSPYYQKLKELLAALFPILSSPLSYGREEAKKAFRNISVFLARHFYAKEEPRTSLQPEALPISQNKHQFFFRDVLQEINTSYTGRITLGSLARKYYVSTSYLSKLFYKETGLHFNDYVLNLRLSDALSLIVFSHYSLSEIAHLCGFPDTRSLHDAFSKANGIGPAEYRKRLKKQAGGSEETVQVVKRLTEEGYFQKLLQYLAAPVSIASGFPMAGSDTPIADSVTLTDSGGSAGSAFTPFIHEPHFEENSSHSLKISEAATRAFTKRFSILLSDWTLLPTEGLRNSLRRLKQEAGLTEIALLLPSGTEPASFAPVSSSEQASRQDSFWRKNFLQETCWQNQLLPMLVSFTDFLYREHLAISLLFSKTPGQTAQIVQSTKTTQTAKTAQIEKTAQTTQTIQIAEAEQITQTENLQITQLANALACRYQGRLVFSCQELQHYSEQNSQILPYFKEATPFHDSCLFAAFLCEELAQAVTTSLASSYCCSYFYTAPSDLACPSPASLPGLQVPIPFSGKPGLFTVSGFAKPAFYAFCFFSRLGAELLYQKEGILITRTENQFQILLYQAAPLLEAYHSTPPTHVSISLQEFPYSYALLTEKRLSPDSGFGISTSTPVPYELEQHLEPVPSFRRSVLPIAGNTLLLEYKLLPGEICLLELEGGYLAR